MKKSAQFLNFWIEIQNRLEFKTINENFSECVIKQFSYNLTLN